MENQIVRKKLYKSGKLWVAALVATVALTTGSVAMADQPGTTATVNDNAAQASQAQAKGTASSSAATTTSQSNQTSAATSQANLTATSTQASLAGQEQNNQLNAFAQKFVNQAIAEGANVNPQNFTPTQVAALNKLEYYSTTPRNTNTTQYTYYDFQQAADKLVQVDPQFAIPYFKAAKIQNFPAATSKDGQTGQVANMDIWDSWPVQDPTTGKIANWNGKQLVIAMMGTPLANSNHLYLLYNDYGSDNFAGWKNAGDIFAGYRGDKKTGLEIPDDQEWSGSAYPLSDGSIELFYTHSKFDHKSINPQNHQRLAAANLKLSLNADGTVSISGVDNDHTIFNGKEDGDNGAHYQTYNKWAHNVTYFDGHREDYGGADNFAMRDPHIVKDEQGNRYLVFEASTGDDDYQSENQIFDLRNYGGNAKFQLESLFNLLNNDYSVKDAVTGKMVKVGRDMRVRASQANAAIGIVQLSGPENNPTVSKVYDPLISALMVSDEIERPDVVKIGDTYYLFAATRLNRGTNDAAWRNANNKVGDNVVMLGWYSKDLTKGFKPLNGSGVVLTSTVPANWRTATYSYYAVPTRSNDPRFKNTVLITSYMTNRSRVADYRNRNGKAVLDKDFIKENGGEHNSTWAPSFLLKLNDDGSTTVLPYATNQGVWDFNDATKLDDDIMTSHANEAYLPWEKGVPFDWGTILSSGMEWVDNLPSEPDIYVIPDNNPIPENPYIFPDQPTQPTKPGQPSQPSGQPSQPGQNSIPSTPTPTSNPSQPSTPSTPGQPSTPSEPGQPTVPGQPSTPGNSTTPSSEPQTPVTPQTPAEQPQRAQTNSRLPQTGNQSTAAAALLGMLGLTTAAGFGLKKRRFN